MAEKKLTQTYELNRDIKKGQYKMLYLHGRPIAYLKKHSVSSKTETEDIATKFSGEFDDKLGGKTTFSITCDALVSNSEGHLSAEKLRHLQVKGNSVPFEICWSRVLDDQGRRNIVKGDIILQGSVIVTDLGEESEHGSYDTLSITLEGSGPLKDKDGKVYGSDEALALFDQDPQSEEI